MTVRARILLVCLGNICRSPTAEAVLRSKLREAGVARRFEIESAGLGGWHAGEAPDQRSQKHARQRGYDLSKIRARRVTDEDFERFDMILAMDEDNLAELHRLAPVGSRARVQLFASVEVPDPYSGGPEGFERVLDIVEAASDRWVECLGR